jgi:hypothetical protein
MDFILYILLIVGMIVTSIVLVAKKPLFGAIVSMLTIFLTFSISQLEYFSNGTFTLRLLDITDKAPILIIAFILMAIGFFKTTEEIRDEW